MIHYSTSHDDGASLVLPQHRTQPGLAAVEHDTSFVGSKICFFLFCLDVMACPFYVDFVRWLRTMEPTFASSFCHWQSYSGDQDIHTLVLFPIGSGFGVPDWCVGTLSRRELRREMSPNCPFLFDGWYKNGNYLPGECHPLALFDLCFLVTLGRSQCSMNG